jgi:prepilin peptidase CpaA
VADVPVRAIADILCAALCVAAAFADLRSRRIPDLLTIPPLFVGLVLAALDGGSTGLFAAALGVALLGGIFAMVAAAGGLGWGDVKLMAAVGALLAWPVGSWSIVLYALFYTALVGGVIAALAAAFQGKLSAALKAAVTLPRREKASPPSGVSIPYGVAICLGSLWAIAGRWVPDLLVG